MFDVRKIPALAVIFFCLGIMSSRQAGAFELTGAWATHTDLCTLVFNKKGNKVMFADLSDLYGSGFIIDGNRIRGKSAQCTIKSRDQKGDSLELSAACATSVMTSSVRFSLKVIDDNNLTRLFAEIPGMMLNYTRCSL
jgi:hypothetical protein